jgi:SAM-dependent methyltransferase
MSCPLCHGENTGHFLDVRDHVTGQAFALQRCRQCSFVFTWPQPADLNQFYPQFYRDYHPLILRFFRFIHSRRVRAWTRARGAGKALEIGCGHGWMLAALRDCGWQATGLERTTESAAFARDTLGLDVRVGELSTLGGQPQFDLIVINQVLEHLPDPMERLQSVAQLLNPGGWLIVGVPNLASWQFQFSRQHWQHLDVPRHLGHFTPATLRGGLERAGLRLENLRTVNWEYDPFGWVQSTLNRLGFQPYLLQHWLSGADRDKIATPAGILMVIVALLLAMPAMALSIISWFAGAGAIMEVRAVKPTQA